MQYFAKDLQSVYKILETLPKPLAVLDFMCGPVGCEFSASQSAGGQFYDKWNQDARVVALCWEGASILYSNISNDQIEFTDKARSRPPGTRVARMPSRAAPRCSHSEIVPTGHM